MSSPVILITGASGFVGQYLLPALRQRWPQAQLEATCLASELPESLAECRWHQLNILDAQAVARCVSELKPDLTIHLAAQANVGLSFSQADLTWQVNLQGSLNVFNALATLPATALLYVSSSDVYGGSFRLGRPLTEQDVLQPLNPYAASKAAADLAAGTLAATSGVRVARARPFNHSGPGQALGFVLPDFAAQIAQIEAGQLAGLKIGNLQAARDFMHVRDVVAAYVALAAELLTPDSALQSGEAINIASGSATPVQQVLDTLLQQAKVEVVVETDPTRLRASDIPLAAGDATRLRELTGWQPSFELQHIVNDVLQDWRQRATLNNG
jgi:GDP-4-dehydro-6-deoxy-D-mannose reductase